MTPRRKRSPIGRDELLEAEIGRVHKDAPRRVALAYPSPYRAAMSSLGYQQVYRLLNLRDDTACDRAVLPERDPAQSEVGPITTLERGLPLSHYPLIAFSVAYELEIAGVIECLERSGIPPLAADRGPNDPLIVAGGPLTFSNPTPLAPFFDVIILGEAEGLLDELIDTCWEHEHDPARVCASLASRPGYYCPTIHLENVPPIHQADDSSLPARAQIITPHTELTSMFLTEAVRGCSRGCTYCVMRRSTNGGMRIIPPETILDGVPEHARRVGLVGAGVTDHPRLVEVLKPLVDAGREIGISSLRADRLTEELVGLLARGGYRTLTVASDGTSERMRRVVERSTTAEDLLRSAELARRHKLHTVKVYMMVGHPDETDEDVEELIRFTLELTKVHPRIALGIAPFIAKRHTPLDGSPFAGIDVVERRLKRIRRGLKGKATVRPTSARWAWVEYMISQGTSKAGLAIAQAHRDGGTFADYKRAFADHGCTPTGPIARVPSTNELISAHRLRRERGDRPLSRAALAKRIE